MADTAPFEVVTFKPWIDPVIDHFDIDPAGHYSRIAWLPIIGPSSWVILGTVALRLHADQSVTWQLSELARDHGLGRPDRPSLIVARTLRRLEYFGLIRFEAPDVAQARTKMPPLSGRQLRRCASHVRVLHDQFFAQATLRQA
jgi:hypothetical protein